MMLGATNTSMKLEIYDLQQEIADQKDIIELRGNRFRIAGIGTSNTAGF